MNRPANIATMYSQPIAHFCTFTTYGTWLHGEKRGSINRKGNEFDTHYLAPLPKLEALRKSQLTQEPLVLDAAMRGCVQRAIEAYCAFRGAALIEVNARTNHVHVAISSQEAPAKTFNGLKAYATRALRNEGLVAQDRRVWTNGGSRQNCFTDDDVARVRRYIRDGQDVDLPQE